MPEVNLRSSAPPPTVDPTRVQAVVFDLGGVLLEGGPKNVVAFGRRIGLQEAVWSALRRELFIDGELWNEVERGERTLDDFAAALQGRLRDHGVEVGLAVAREFMGRPGEADSHPVRAEVLAAVERLHALMPTALLTNNIAEWRGGWRRRLPVADLFDLVVDSSEVGTRKPEERIYRLVEQGLGLPGEALLLVDDLGVNLKTAKRLGWQTLKYVDTAEVLATLDSIADAAAEAGLRRG